MSQLSISIDNIVINIIRRRVKYMRLGIYSPIGQTGQVRVISPMRFKDEEIKNFVISKLSWIKKHLEKFKSNPNPDHVGLSDAECRIKLNKLIPDLIIKWQTITGIEVAEWRIRKMKTRWGTCNTRAKRIWINLALGNKSLNCLEYIIVHEMVHILEPSHNSRFKYFMDKFMPQWRMYKRELKNYC